MVQYHLPVTMKAAEPTQPSTQLWLAILHNLGRGLVFGQKYPRLDA